ncbi:unnamed protein product [Mytilus coruscus]|uniref:SGNH hydrolase-type esterase domain-containing protein n=1 Tax=Mytilus coruscus TaxID=42192 RepID=A0A6J8B3L4_MYTCO|nr:unnamed protein product [Mytilus coruscus]
MNCMIGKLCYNSMLPGYVGLNLVKNKWSDDTADIETPLLASAVRSRQNRVRNKSASIVKAPTVWFCSDFQKKKCSFSGAHNKVIKGSLDVVNFLEYGFPLSCEGSCSGLSVEKNHAGARSHPDDMRKYLKKECTYGSIIGPFFSNPFETDMVISPLNSVPKKDTLDRRVILDLSFGVDGEDSVNSHICKDLYLGNPIKVTYPSVDSLVELIRRKGSDNVSKNKVLLLSDSTCKYVNNINWLECNAISGANIYTLHQFVKDNKALLRRYTHLLLHVGTNDVGNGLSSKLIIQYYNNLIDFICNTLPSLKIIVSAILPRPIDFDDTKQTVIDCNKRIGEVNVEEKYFIC